MLRSKEDKAAKTAATSNKTDKTTEDKSEQTSSNVDVQEIKIDTGDPESKKEVSITISSMGDCTLGTDVNFNQSTSLNAYYNMNGPDYFFQNVRSILEKDDLSIVNMEGTLTDSTTREDKTYAFKAPAEYAGILSGSSVEAANLANNHSSDYGSQSNTDTIKALEDAGVATFGFDQTKILDIKGVKVGLTGIYELAEHMGKAEQVKENIAALKEAGAQLIIVNFQWKKNIIQMIPRNSWHIWLLTAEQILSSVITRMYFRVWKNIKTNILHTALATSVSAEIPILLTRIP